MLKVKAGTSEFEITDANAMLRRHPGTKPCVFFKVTQTKNAYHWLGSEGIEVEGQATAADMKAALKAMLAYISEIESSSKARAKSRGIIRN